MFQESKILLLKTLTPTHVGSGNDLGIVDLPIQREKHTGFPKIEGSSLKGSIREAFEQKLGEASLDIHLTFGYDEDSDKSKMVEGLLEKNNTRYAGSLGFSDSRLLFFPVKSVKHIYALCTCPFILKRLVSDFNVAGIKNILKVNNLKLDQSKVMISENFSKVHRSIGGKNVVMLEEYSFEAEDIPADLDFDFFEKLRILFGESIMERLVILSDDDFQSFVENTTEVVTRTKINNETGTVKKGGLFNEEYLPAESYLYSLIFASSLFNQPEVSSFKPEEGKSQASKVIEWFENTMPPVFQVGANATLGKGITGAKFYEVKK